MIRKFIHDRSFRRISLQSDLEGALRETKERHLNEATMTGFPCGISSLDNFTKGLHKGELVLIAVRNMVEKEALARFMGGYCAIESRAPTVFLSLGIGKLRMTQYLLSAFSNVPFHYIRTGVLEPHNWALVAQGAAYLTNAPVFIEDKRMDICEIKKRVSLLKRKHKVELLIVDNLERIKPVDKDINRRAHFEQICRELKELAKTLDIAVVLTCELPRQGDRRDTLPHIINDLYKGGDVEEYADVILFVLQHVSLGWALNRWSSAEVIVEKNADRPTGSVIVNYIESSNFFESRMYVYT